MIERDLLAKALEYQDRHLSVLKLQHSIAQDRGDSPETIEQMEATIASLESNKSAVIPLLDLSQARAGDWGELELHSVSIREVVDSGFFGEGSFRQGRVFFAGWGVETDARMKFGDHCSIVGGATVACGQDSVLIVRRAFVPDELRAAIVAEQANSQSAAAFKENGQPRGRTPPARSNSFVKRVFAVALVVGCVSLIRSWKLGDIGDFTGRTKQEAWQESAWKLWNIGDLTREQLVVIVEPAIVRLDVEGPSGSAFGSGFVIDESGIVVTNYDS